MLFRSLVALPFKKHFSCVLEFVFCLVATTDMLCKWMYRPPIPYPIQESILVGLFVGGEWSTTWSSNDGSTSSE